MTYDEGIVLARKLIKYPAHFCLPNNLSNDFLALIVQCYDNEKDNSKSALPLMLVIHMWRCDENCSMTSVFDEIHNRFLQYKNLCKEEQSKRYSNMIQFDQLASVAER